METVGKNILISSLGYTPGVVTGTIDALKAFDDVDIHQVLTISTRDSQILNLAVEEVLIPEFNTYYSGKIKYDNDSIDVNDLVTAADNDEYLSKAIEHIQTSMISPDIDGIYISLAGGRKTMSALMMTAVNLIVTSEGGCQNIPKLRELTHIIVDDYDVERYGLVSNDSPDSLHEQTDEEIRRKVLHPIKTFGKDSDIVHLIRMRGVFNFDFTPVRQAKTLAEKIQRWKEGLRNRFK